MPKIWCFNGVRFISCFCKINIKSVISRLTFFYEYCIIIVTNYKCDGRGFILCLFPIKL